MNPLAELIRREIETSGPVTFARFMERALYEAELGYYERQQEIGRGGDFYTSVSVGSLFGQLLALQFAAWLEELITVNSSATSVQIVEAGAHKGQLAADMLGWLKTHRPELYAQLEYLIVEPSPKRRAWQQQTLAGFRDRVGWITSLDHRSVDVTGIIFSNELLDAMPVHRLRWSAATKQWKEWAIGLRAAEFVWDIIPLANRLEPYLPETPRELADLLPDGFTVEVCPSACEWWRQAACSLIAGKLLTIDYGFAAEDFLAPERGRGTLRMYSGHRVGSDLLKDPGFYDITAHVNFSALQQTGESEGLITETFLSQSRFLTQVFEKAIQEKDAFGNPADWIRQFQTLTHPEHLGRSFKVLVQSRAKSG